MSEKHKAVINFKCDACGREATFESQSFSSTQELTMALNCSQHDIQQILPNGLIKTKNHLRCLPCQTPLRSPHATA